MNAISPKEIYILICKFARYFNFTISVLMCVSGSVTPVAGMSNGRVLSGRGCSWKYARYGVFLYCGSNQVVAGRCGSGQNGDCYRGNNHGIYCCPFGINNN